MDKKKRKRWKFTFLVFKTFSFIIDLFTKYETKTYFFHNVF